MPVVAGRLVYKPREFYQSGTATDESNVNKQFRFLEIVLSLLELVIHFSLLKNDIVCSTFSNSFSIMSANIAYISGDVIAEDGFLKFSPHRFK